ncbi:MAG: mercuric reductase [Syntrophobacteraceae bacterium]
MPQGTVPRLDPDDDFNQLLLSNVHPANWRNPIPRGRYNLVVIGAGTAGLVTAAGAAGLGAKVALVEKYLLGGDCLNTGCVPSKAIIRSSRAAQELRKAGSFGVGTGNDVKVDFPAVMERMRGLRSRISFHDSAERFRQLGVDVYLGEAQFTGRDSIRVGSDTLRFSKAVVATGARAAHPAIEGLDAAGYFTNETIFSLTERPRRLAVIGGGPLGCELAQAFRRLGSEVAVIQRAGHLLGREDNEAANILQSIFLQEGIQLFLNSTPIRVILNGRERLIIYVEDGKEQSVAVDEILVAAGRAPNVEGLGLEAAGVAYDQHEGIQVNDYLQTTNDSIYAAGDVCLQYKFTHMADATARIVIQNSLFLGHKKLSGLTIPWVTYTEPEIAHVGLHEEEARKRGLEVETFFIPMKEVDRAILDGETDGFVKITTRRGTDKILGATIVAGHAGEMINEISLAIANGLGLGSLSNIIHPYPTQAEAIRKAADLFNRGRLTPFVSRVFSLWLRALRSDTLLMLERGAIHLMERIFTRRPISSRKAGN